MTIEESEYHDANKVRVVKFDDITLDLCGGTHVQNSQDIEDFKVISVDSKGTGIYRLRVITSTNEVDKYLDQEIYKKIALLNTLIKNNQTLDSSYKLEIPQHNAKNSLQKEKVLDEYDKLEQKIRDDYKTLLKQKQNVTVDVDKYKPESINNKNVYIIFENDVPTAKKIAVELREAHNDALIISLAKTSSENNYFLVVASKKYDAMTYFNIIAKHFNGKGGGNNIICQGSIKIINSQKEFILELKKVLNA